ncbi:MAG: adenylate/guanylate cyclase domain-containing protein [Armatimonadetes bacterium]|nr:adenylate/guanylate cyclase domain-containing protein [Armatimonadota bacterium]MDW8028381.1 adenylate/guanylate cyclase domain-containing protein [Armatimonadota bacterium]
MQIELQIRLKRQRYRNFYAFGVVTLLSTFLGWSYLDNLLGFYSGQTLRNYSEWQLQLGALFYDFCLRLKGFVQPEPAPMLLSPDKEREWRKSLNDAFRHLPDIVIVSIDDQTVRSLKQAGIPYPPMPRSVYGELLRKLKQAGAKVVAFDLHMNLPSPFGEEDDREFELAIGEAQNVVLACRLFSERVSGGFVITYEGPYQTFAARAAGIGLIEMTLDPWDRTIRAATVAVPYRDEWIPSLGTIAAALWLGKSEEQLQKDLRLRKFNGISLPLVFYQIGAERNFEGLTFAALLLNFAGFEKSFRYIPLETLLFHERNGLTESELRQIFEGKLVFVGDTSELGKDIFLTPVSVGFPGVEIHATLAQMLLSGKFLSLVPRTWLQVLMLIFVASVTAIVFWLRPLKAFPIILLLSVLVLFLALKLLDKYMLVLPIAPFYTSGAFAFILSTIYLQFTVERHARHIRQRFGRFMAPSILQTVIVASEKELSSPRRVKATVLFTDLKGFTTISEERPPEEVVSILNEHFEAITAIIYRHEGIVSKFIGDAIMALFGAPIYQPDHAARAVRCAVEMQWAMEDLRRKLKDQGLPELFMRIGIHTGEMVFGAIGSKRHSDLTVIGDTVNVASRLEGMNKEFGSSILISEMTYEEAKASGAKIVAEAVGEVSVRGRIRPLRVYKVLGADGILLPELKTSVNRQVEDVIISSHPD